MHRPEISIVSPVYLAEEILPELVRQIQQTMEQMKVSYEIVLVDDRGPDQSWTVMKQLSESVPELKCIRLSRNFGQHPAIMAGLTHSLGNWVVVMDCDLQDQPKEILRLYDKTREGYDIVLARRRNRQDSRLKRLSSALFSKIYGYFTETQYDNEIANFGIYNKKVISAVLDVSDYIKFFPLFVSFAGFQATSIEVEHAQRKSGETSYSLMKLIRLAANTILSFSNKPLKLFVKFGLFISAGSLFVGTYYLYEALQRKIEVMGYASLIVSIWFLSGVIITTIGITGIYIGKIFDQAKGRPVFIVDEII